MSLALDVTTPPCVPLVGDEHLICTHQVEYLDRGGLGWLTSKRVIVRVSEPNPVLQTRMAAAATPGDAAELGKLQQFLLPLAQVTAHNVSAATNLQKLLLKLHYAGAKGPASVVIRFISQTALEDRTKWKEYLTLHQGAGTAAATSTTTTPATPATPAPPAAATPMVLTPAVATPSTPAAPTVKLEPGLSRPTPTSTPRTPSGKRAHGSAHGPGTTPATAGGAAADHQALIRARAALLARDPQLQAVHSELVPAAVSEEEFWASRTDQLKQEQGRQSGAAGAGTGIIAGGGLQRAGISSAMASTIRPDTGCNVVRYTLDPSQIHAIFLESPMVYELYQTLVPDQLDEKTFWTKYFKSQYIHSQASAAVESELKKNATKNPNAAEEDLFARVNRMQDEKEQERLGGQVRHLQGDLDPVEFARQQAEVADKRDLQARATIVQRHVDPSVDLTSADMSDSIMLADPTKSNGAPGGEGAPSSNTTRSKRARAQTELLQKFNRHGMLVLDSNLNGGGATKQATNGSHHHSHHSHNSSSRAPLDAAAADRLLQSSYHTSLASSLDLVDLSITPEPAYNTLAIGQGFFEAMGARKRDVKATEEELQAEKERHRAGVRAFLDELGAFPSLDSITTPAASSATAAPSSSPAPRHSVQHIPASVESRDILLELTSIARGMNKAAIAAKQLKEEQAEAARAGGGGARLHGASAPRQQLIVFSTNPSEADMVIPDQFREELRKRYHTCTELFRHFWASLNVRTQAKLQRVHGALDEQYRLLQVIRTSLNSRGYSQLVPLLNPLIASIDMCSTTFAKWQEKQAKAAAPRGRTMNNQATPAARAATPTQNTGEAEPESKRIKV